MKILFYLISLGGILLSTITILKDQDYLPISYIFFSSSTIYFLIGPYVFLLLVKSVFNFKQPYKFYLNLSVFFIIATLITHSIILTHTGAKGWGFYAIPSLIVLLIQYLVIVILTIIKFVQLYKLKKEKIT